MPESPSEDMSKQQTIDQIELASTTVLCTQERLLFSFPSLCQVLSGLQILIFTLYATLT